MKAFDTEISANRMRGSELSEAQRMYCIAQLEAGASTREVADALSCTQRCVQKTLQRWKTTSSITSQPRTDCGILMLPIQVFRSVLCSAMADKGYRKLRAERRPKINSSTAKERLGFADDWLRFDFGRRTVGRALTHVLIDIHRSYMYRWFFLLSSIYCVLRIEYVPRGTRASPK